jgi:DNA-binding transcriptional regulator YiaG
VNKLTSKKCSYCGGKGKIAITTYFPVSKMKKIMKKYDLSQVKVAKICGLSQPGVSEWFRTNKNTKGVKKDYFEILAKKGYL